MKTLITGGAGFIGCNVAMHHLEKSDEVIILDNLSRSGSDINLAWLQKKYANRFTFIKGTVADDKLVMDTIPTDTDVVYHLAGQVAVTKSVEDPRDDFSTNALGSLNVLEAVRAKCPEAIVFYSSTNKVYGGMEFVEVVEEETRYSYANLPHGINEGHPLDFHSPYGCSKGCGDQYVHDYSRIYGLRTVVFRQSCIYGGRQFGIIDQGWVAYLCNAAKQGHPITVYGNGKQVRDVLWIDDLIRAFGQAIEHIDDAAGQVFNIGGGPGITTSIWLEFAPRLEKLAGRKLDVTYGDWRPGDQRVYISDIRKAKQIMDWEPIVNFDEGLNHLWQWIETS